jgi:hypothetical protein
MKTDKMLNVKLLFYYLKKTRSHSGEMRSESKKKVLFFMFEAAQKRWWNFSPLYKRIFNED